MVAVVFSWDRLDRCSGLVIKFVVIVLLKETNIALNFALYFVKINTLNDELKQDCFLWNLVVNFKVYNII